MFNLSILKSESFKKGIAFSTVLNFFSKGLSFCTTILIAYYFGTSLETDIYFFILSIITSISMFITGCTTSVIIPEVMHLNENGRKDEAIKITNTILLAFTILTAVPAFLFSIIPVQVFSRISQFSDVTIIEHRFYFSISSLLLILITINTYLKEVLSIYRFFSLPMVISLINSLFIIISIPLLKNHIGMKSVMTGLILGNSINGVMLVYTLCKYVHWRFNAITFKIPGKFLGRIFYSQAGYAVTSANMLVQSYLLSGVSAGLIAALNFGRQVSDIPGNFLTAQFSAVSGIKFNELTARKQFSDLDMAFRKSTSFLLSILCPVCGIIFVFNTEIVEILFGRGVFSSASIADTAILCKLFILSSPLIAIIFLSTRILIAAKKIRQSFWYQIGSNLLSILIMFLLFPRYGAKTIPVTIFIAYGLSIIAQPIMFHFLCPHIRYLKTLSDNSVVLIVNIIIMIGVFLFDRWLKQYGFESFIRLLAGSVLYLMVVYISNLLFNINNDLQNILRNINTKIKSVLITSFSSRGAA
jgi:putative peptidoglycan lipid II flippase